jgi:hypothetical protein
MSKNMENEFMKRGYLLPEGCKDMVDVLTPKKQPEPPVNPGSSAQSGSETINFSSWSEKGETIVPVSLASIKTASETKLAEILGSPSYQDFLDLIKKSHSTANPGSPAPSNIQVISFSPWSDEIPLAEMPPVNGEIIIPAKTSAVDLASLLERNLVEIIADLHQLGVIPSQGFPLIKSITEALKEPLDFETISKIARRYGLIAKRASA